MSGIAIGSDFSLVDHFGKTVSQTDYEGQFALIFFGFTHCKLVCPRALTRISKALDLLGRQAEAIRPLYITVDPERDTPEVMRFFLENAWSRFTGLTGSRADIDRVRAGFKVFATRVDGASAAGGYDMPHSSLTYLMDPNFRYRAHYPDTMDAERLADELRHEVAQDVKDTQ